MGDLIFDRETHTYTLDGEVIPSVSEITRFIAKEVYGECDPVMLSNAAERGTAVHEATETLDKHRTVEVSDELNPYLAAYVKFHKEHEVVWDEIEWSVHCGTAYAGTLDRYGWVDGEPCILDIKTTCNISSKHRRLYEAAQNLYRIAIGRSYQVKHLYILQLKKDGNYKLIELPIDDALPDACLTLHNALRKRLRKGKGKHT